MTEALHKPARRRWHPLVRAGVVTLALPFVFLGPLVVIALWPGLKVELGTSPLQPPTLRGMGFVPVSLSRNESGGYVHFQFSVERFHLIWIRDENPLHASLPRGFSRDDALGSDFDSWRVESWAAAWLSDHQCIALIHWK